MNQPLTTQKPLNQMNTLLLYGELLTGKTTQIGNIARWVYEQTGKTTRIISGDGGGFEPLSDLIDLRIIDPVSIAGRPDLLATLMAMARGDWFVEGKFIKPDPLKGNDLSQVGLYVVEGTRFLCETMKGNLLGQGQNFTKADLVTDFSVKQEDSNEMFNFGLPIQTHYGFAQNYIQQVIFSFISLLRKIDARLVFTTHNYESEADPTKAGSKTVIGPATTGQALVSSLPSMFAQTIHLTKEEKTELVPSEEKGKPPTRRYWTEHKAWFRPHKDKKLNAFWEATLRFSQPQLKFMKESADERWLRGFEVLEEGDERGIVRLFEWKDEIREKAAQRMKEEIENSRLEKLALTAKGDG